MCSAKKFGKRTNGNLLCPVSSHLSCLSTIFWSKQHFMTQNSRRMRDDRQSPSYVLMDLLQDRGAEVAYYDPYMPLIKPTREHPRSGPAQQSVGLEPRYNRELRCCSYRDQPFVGELPRARRLGAMHRGHPKRHGQRACCARKSLESIGTHERNEVTTTQGFSLVFTARPHMSFTVWLIGFFFTLGLAYLFQKMLGRSYWRSWRSLSSGRWFSGDMLRQMLK